MTDQSADGIRDRLTKGGEDAIGRVAQELLENPVISSALARAFEARERASQAQEVAMGALNLPSAADLERLTRRVRSVAQRLEGIEDSVDRLDERLSKNVQLSLEETLASIDQRLAAIEASLPASQSS
jgi:CRP-like cAMP-binding protein